MENKWTRNCALSVLSRPINNQSINKWINKDTPICFLGHLISPLTAPFLWLPPLTFFFLFFNSINYLILVCVGASFNWANWAFWSLIRSYKICSLVTAFIPVFSERSHFHCFWPPVAIGPYSNSGSMTVLLCTELHRAGSTQSSLRAPANGTECTTALKNIICQTFILSQRGRVRGREKGYK